MAMIESLLLRKIPLFSLLDDEELRILAPQLEELKFLAGQLIFSEGDEGGTMFVIESGKVELYLQDQKGDVVVLGVRKDGELFGELALLDTEKHSASAKALSNVKLFRIDRNDLEVLIKSQPRAALGMMTVMGQRIREADVLVQERVARNVNEEYHPPESFGEKLADRLTHLSGDIRFVYLSVIWFGVWVIVNVGLIPFIKPFDPFPFGLLTMIVSLEAIFLSLFVLISQNRQASHDKVRNDIEYAVNIKAEIEIRALSQQVENLQQMILDHLSDIKDSEK